MRSPERAGVTSPNFRQHRRSRRQRQRDTDRQQQCRSKAESLDYVDSRHCCCQTCVHRVRPPCPVFWTSGPLRSHTSLRSPRSLGGERNTRSRRCQRKRLQTGATQLRRQRRSRQLARAAANMTLLEDEKGSTRIPPQWPFLRPRKCPKMASPEV